MQKNVRNREKGTGTIEKKRNRFYLKLRIGDKTKNTLLLGKDDKPVTTRRDAEAAAALLRPIMRAQQKEEIAIYVAEARKMRHEQSIEIKKNITTEIAGEFFSYLWNEKKVSGRTYNAYRQALRSTYLIRSRRFVLFRFRHTPLLLCVHCQ